MSKPRYPMVEYLNQIQFLRGRVDEVVEEIVDLLIAGAKELGITVNDIRYLIDEQVGITDHDQTNNNQAQCQ